MEARIGLQELRNVDLFRQGLYIVRVSCFSLADAAAVVKARAAPRRRKDGTLLRPFYDLKSRTAIPFDHSGPLLCGMGTSALREMGCLTAAESASLPASIDGSQCSFSTRAFRIQYADQTVGLEEQCKFKLYLPMDQIEYPCVFVDLELLFTEFHSSSYMRKEPLPDRSSFEVVACTTLQLQGLREGIHA